MLLLSIEDVWPNTHHIHELVHYGKVGLDQAREIYSLAIDSQTWDMNAVETERLRAGGSAA